MENDALAFVLVIYYFGGAAVVGWLAALHGRNILVYVLGCLVFPIATLPAILYLTVLARRRQPADVRDESAPDRLYALERLTHSTRRAPWRTRSSAPRRSDCSPRDPFGGLWSGHLDG